MCNCEKHYRNGRAFPHIGRPQPLKAHFILVVYPHEHETSTQNTKGGP
jgi:hypothetical protein